MKRLYSVILILLCFIFLLACANANAGSASGTQPDTGETTVPIQNDNPSDTTVADKTTQPSGADDIETASPVTLGPDETIPPQSIDSTDRSISMLVNKLYSSFEKDPEDARKFVYPDDYAGSYDGDDGYLHIMLTSLDNVDHYKAIIDPSLVQFHTVKFSFNQLCKVMDALEEKLQEYKLLYPPYVTNGDNIVTIQTYSEDMVDDIKAFLDAKSIDSDLYKIIIYKAVNGIIPQ